MEIPFIAVSTRTGDVDGDDDVDILDVLTLNKNLLGVEILTVQGRRNADVDKNGVADSTDSLNILKAVVKLIDLEDFTN